MIPDDTGLVGTNSNEEGALYHKQIESFVNWRVKNYLYFNVSKTTRCVLTSGRI